MGDTRTNIDWDPSHSTIGQTITGQSGSAFKNPDIYDPNQSTGAQFAKGNYGEAANQALGGAKNLVQLGWNMEEGMLNPFKQAGDTYDTISGKPQAEKRHDQDVKNQTADYEGVQRAQEIQRQQQEQQASAQKAQQDKLSAYNLQQQGVADEDAFTKARNAAIKAKGQTLFGAWG